MTRSRIWFAKLRAGMTSLRISAPMRTRIGVVKVPPGKSEDASFDMAEVAAPTNARIVARLKAQDRSHGPTTEEIAATVQEERRR